MTPLLFIAGRMLLVMPNRAPRPHEARVRELMARCDDVILVMIEVAKLADQLLEELLATDPPLEANGPPIPDDPLSLRGFE